MVSWNRIQGKWAQLKGDVQQQWGELTNDDLDQIAGERTQLIGKIQERYGVDKWEAEQQVEAFVSACRC